MKKILKYIYRITLMPHLERDKYFDIIVDEAMEMCEKIVKNIKT